MKKLLLIILLIITIKGSCLAMATPITVGIEGEASVMKPVPITIDKSKVYALGDRLVIEAGDSSLRITIDQDTLEKEWPIKASLYIKSPETLIHYSHYRGDLTIDEKELMVSLSDLPAIGVLSSLDQITPKSARVKSYDLSAKDILPSTLNMLDYLYINSFYTETLSDQAVEDLLTWIAKGGLLLVQSDIGQHETYTGFLKIFEGQELLSYQFGQIINTSDVDKTLEHMTSQRLYPKVSVNNYRGLNKSLLKLNTQNSWTTYFIAIGLGILAVLILYLPRLSKSLKYLGYGGLLLATFILMSFTHVKSLTSVSGIEWHKGSATRSLICLHTLESDLDDLSGVFKADATELFRSQSEDEGSLIRYTEKISTEDLNNLASQITLKNGHLKGQLTWLNQRPLEKSVLIIGANLIPIGTLENNQKVNLDYHLSQETSDLNDYQRQINLVKKGHWSMDEGLIFNEFQAWYQLSNNFDDHSPLLIGLQSEESSAYDQRMVTVESITFEGGGLNE